MCVTSGYINIYISHMKQTIKELIQTDLKVVPHPIEHKTFLHHLSFLSDKGTVHMDLDIVYFQITSTLIEHFAYTRIFVQQNPIRNILPSPRFIQGSCDNFVKLFCAQCISSNGNNMHLTFQYSRIDSVCTESKSLCIIFQPIIPVQHICHFLLICSALYSRTLNLLFHQLISDKNFFISSYRLYLQKTKQWKYHQHCYPLKIISGCMPIIQV